MPTPALKLTLNVQNVFMTFSLEIIFRGFGHRQIVILVKKEIIFKIHKIQSVKVNNAIGDVKYLSIISVKKFHLSRTLMGRKIKYRFPT